MRKRPPPSRMRSRPEMARPSTREERRGQPHHPGDGEEQPEPGDQRQRQAEAPGARLLGGRKAPGQDGEEDDVVDPQHHLHGRQRGQGDPGLRLREQFDHVVRPRAGGSGRGWRRRAHLPPARRRSVARAPRAPRRQRQVPGSSVGGGASGAPPVSAASRASIRARAGAATSDQATSRVSALRVEPARRRHRREPAAPVRRSVDPLVDGLERPVGGHQQVELVADRAGGAELGRLVEAPGRDQVRQATSSPRSASTRVAPSRVASGATGLPRKRPAARCGSSPSAAASPAAILRRGPWPPGPAAGSRRQRGGQRLGPGQRLQPRGGGLDQPAQRRSAPAGGHRRLGPAKHPRQLGGDGGLERLPRAEPGGLVRVGRDDVGLAAAHAGLHGLEQPQLVAQLPRRPPIAARRGEEEPPVGLGRGEPGPELDGGGAGRGGAGACPACCSTSVARRRSGAAGGGAGSSSQVASRAAESAASPPCSREKVRSCDASGAGAGSSAERCDDTASSAASSAA